MDTSTTVILSTPPPPRLIINSGKLHGHTNLSSKLKMNVQILELASSPLLLTPLTLPDFQQLKKRFCNCLVVNFTRSASTPLRKRHRGGASNVIRSVWSLMMMDLELVDEVAYKRFLGSEYFFEQSSLERQICAFFSERALPTGSGEFRPEAILNSIEAHTGLMVQRAVRVYSFSHLTFQEYLTAQRVSKKPTLLNEIGPFVGDPRWNDVWTLLVTMLDPDDVVSDLRRRTDDIVRGNSQIESFLSWCVTKAEETATDYAPSAVRTLYFHLEVARFLDDAHDPAIVHDLSRDLEDQAATFLSSGHIAPELVHHHVTLQGRGPLRHLWSVEELDARLARDLSHEIVLHRAKHLHLDIVLAQLLDFVFAKTGQRGSHATVGRILDRAAAAADLSHSSRMPEMHVFRSSLPAYSDPGFPEWCERLREYCVQHRNIGRRWKFTEEDTKLLDAYSRANRLLLRCLREARSLTNAVRESVRTSIMLPPKTSGFSSRPHSA